MFKRGAKRLGRRAIMMFICWGTPFQHIHVCKQNWKSSISSLLAFLWSEKKVLRYFVSCPCFLLVHLRPKYISCQSLGFWIPLIFLKQSLLLLTTTVRLVLFLLVEKYKKKSAGRQPLSLAFLLSVSIWESSCVLNIFYLLSLFLVFGKGVAYEPASVIFTESTRCIGTLKCCHRNCA